jgi:7,8-dihydro-6-hydroxymethylpterin-pyrophosphokinase
MNIAFLSIGGNINNRLQNLKLCLELVKMNCGSIENKSNIYESEAWGVNSKIKYLKQTI